VIAQYVDIERTYVYKVLIAMTNRNLVSVTEKNGIKHFVIPDITILKKYIKNEQSKYEKMTEEFHDIEIELQSHKK
jgi:hypothetical protein